MANTTSKNSNSNEELQARRDWLTSLQKGDSVQVVIHEGNSHWSPVQEKKNVTLSRAGRKYFEIEGFAGQIFRHDGKGKDAHGRHAIISPVPVAKVKEKKAA